MLHVISLEYLQLLLFVFMSHLLETRLRRDDLELGGLRFVYARPLQDRDSSVEYRAQPQGHLIHFRSWSVILKRIRMFKLNFHITHTFPHHVDISFCEVGMSDVIDVLHCDMGRNLTVRDALCLYLLLNAFEGEAICCNTDCVGNNQSLYVVP